MKSLFIKLKSRITNEAEEVPETPEASTGSMEKKSPPPAHEPSSAPHPGSALLGRRERTSPKAEDPAWLSRSTATPAAQPEKKSSVVEPLQKIAMVLGDFIRRIPPDLLAEGPHNMKQRVWFKISDLSANVAQGKPTIPLSQLAKMCPELFLSEITPDRDAEIYFPWNKLVAQMRAARLSPEEIVAAGFPSFTPKDVAAQKQKATKPSEQITGSVEPAASPARRDEAPRPPVASLRTRWQNQPGQTSLSTSEVPSPESPFEKISAGPPSSPEPNAKIDSLNVRLESLTLERDAALAQAVEARTSAKAQSEALTGQHQQEMEALIRERDALKTKLSVLSEQQTLAGAQRDDALAELVRLRETHAQQLAALTEECDSVRDEKQNVLARFAQGTDAARRQIDALTAERDEALAQSARQREQKSATELEPPLRPIAPSPPVLRLRAQ